MSAQDISAALQQQVLQAAKSGTALRIIGGNSKAFYGGVCRAQAQLEMLSHHGVIDYEPSEMVITARAGSRVTAIAALLASQCQMLGFEPPDFAGHATLGGTLAGGFSGPRRPFVGSGRDFMLGCKIINGQGQILNFGGRVMKNVAGFDVSRLMVGAMGTLGVLLEVSLRVLPMPESDITLVITLSHEQAILKMSSLSAQPWPISALAYENGRLRLRLSGAQTAVAAAARQLGGDLDAAGQAYWLGLREHRLAFFQQPGSLWRISLAPAAAPLSLSGQWLLDWGGALRWLKTDMSATVIHAAVQAVGGHAVCYNGEDKSDWMRLDAGMLALQRRIRLSFDPLGLFNPGRLFF